MSKLLPISPICLTSTESARLVNVIVYLFLVVIAIVNSFVIVLVIHCIISFSIRLILNVLLVISPLAQLLVRRSRVIVVQHLRLLGDGTVINATIVLVSSIVLARAILR